MQIYLGRDGVKGEGEMGDQGLQDSQSEMRSRDLKK